VAWHKIFFLSQNRYTMSCPFCDFLNEHCLVCTRRLVASQEYNVLHLKYLRWWPHFITGVKSLKAKESLVRRIGYLTKNTYPSVVAIGSLLA
jgi:hypothetical protein